MSKFIKRSDGIWDTPECCECCSDCSSCEEDCTCPLDIEGACDNCIFKNGYKKCKECCTKPRTTNEHYCQIGYWHMCDDCISKIFNEKGVII